MYMYTYTHIDFKELTHSYGGWQVQNPWHKATWWKLSGGSRCYSLGAEFLPQGSLSFALWL